MGDTATYAALTSIFREQLRAPELRIAPETTPDDVPGWDSGTMVLVIMAVEERFGIEFGSDELREIRSVGDLARLVQRHGH